MYGTLRRQGKVSDYSRAFADKIGKAEANFAAVIGLVSWVPETFMSGVLDDPRVLKHYHRLREAVLDEVAHLENLEGSVWIDLSAHTSHSPAQLRDTVMRGVHPATGYLSQKAQELSGMPWCLATESMDPFGLVDPAALKLRAMSIDQADPTMSVCESWS